MSGKSLQDLDLKEEVLPAQSLDDLPEVGGFTPLPQPGAYKFALPADLSGVWDVFDTQKGQRVRMILDRDHPLTIVASPGNKSNGDSFQTRLANAERPRGKERIEVSDLDYLLKALGEKVRPTSNRGYIEALGKHGGGQFAADLNYNWTCSDSRNIWVLEGEERKEVEGQKGCGWRYYIGTKSPDTTKQIGYVQKGADGLFPSEIQCQCGAILRAFGNLDNIRL